MSSKENRGFTLIELIVVITLLTGLSTILLLNASESRSITDLNAATRQLESVFMQAQAYGRSGKAFPEGSSNFDAGYGVYVQDESGTVIIYGGQGDTNPNDGDIGTAEEKYVSGHEYEIIQLYGGVVVTNIDTISGGNNRDYCHTLYRRGEAEVHMHTDAQNNVEGVIITLEKNGMTRKVYVNKTGLVYTE